ncbi:hypothetical protein O3M35_013215 [Rhynocoris fuscipes]|uniref:LRRNT domain-containing protein n=1 Tax=Rhynocoris fuscipes TaxID=488301 RepID=A0AAW1CGG5_9HEMI
MYTYIKMFVIFYYITNELTIASKQSLSQIGGHPIPVKFSTAIQAITNCPRICSCIGLAIDCSRKAITQIPRNLPQHVERL